MAELGLERHHAVSHSELTSGHDVTNLLSQINQNFKQSKADQILRLLQDQDKVTDNSTDSVADDTELLREYDQIKEERVLCDSDTLTDSSSDSGDTLNTVNIPETEVSNSRQNKQAISKNMQEYKTEAVESRDMRGFRRHRARTSFGFHADMNDEVNNESVPVNFDTRDLNIRPKSSYVRRHQFKKREEPDHVQVEPDVVEPPPQRPSKSARPKSRLGRSSVPKTERKIVMMEADVVATEPENVPPSRDESVRGGANNMYDRFSSVRQPKRESKRTKAFCDSNFVTQQQTVENVNVDSASLMDTGDDFTEVQTIAPNSNVTNTRGSYLSNFTNSQVPRNSPIQTNVQHVQKRPNKSYSRPEQNHNNGSYQTPAVPYESHLIRTDTMTSNGTLRAERPDNISPTSQIPLKRNNSNLAYARPKNPEPVTSRPIERPDIRPSTRTRRLHRRYMAPTQSHMSQVRPTSESVILARQKTEKNLMKKQAENRPHSEKIIINSQSKNIDLNLNPTQGPQTFVTSKGGVTQASHVHEGGFRGYDPTSRLKSSVQARDLPSDLTLPRRGQNNVVMGGRQPLAALMKLPSLEASLAAKKKERGLTLAARETCV
ncbi:uncharacterized protein LOC132719911 [Ruditapes philippinarum]|uniref:uncharacterized protein LOC132719911 n=1 Tax=Ruditapes philippinarum TaxID=129788 RepID=UPI00295B3025|nr:uncharacterized protein LOC132719911 [Ruditapes philippinarum]XP_060559851.1 uncharacterized protein LOC132719911 [Ruditapes philippinarum]XP_060559852.1 uncharacterized protein LOC132719911 [Ruditapes philippinarum]